MSAQIDDENNILEDGTLIDLCGATLLWRSATGLLKTPVNHCTVALRVGISPGSMSCSAETGPSSHVVLVPLLVLNTTEMEAAPLKGQGILVHVKGISMRTSKSLWKHLKWTPRPRPGAVEARAFTISLKCPGLITKQDEKEHKSLKST